MKVGVIIPDRGDRPKFLENCKRLMKAQTRQPNYIALMNAAPTSAAPDLTRRVREGFEMLRGLKCDCVLIIENDDYYCEYYIETMLNEWSKAGKPDIFGVDSTVYYHITKRGFRTLKHKGRASLMSTLIKCSAEIKFPKDSEVFLDQILWKQLDGKTFSIDEETQEHISIGIKHGQGLCGGRGHSTMKFEHKESRGMFILSVMTDPISHQFYKTIAAELSKAPNNQKKQTA